MVRAEYTLAQLASAAGMTARNVRAYRQRGLVDPPQMRGRRGVYGPEHLTQLRMVRALVARGFSLTEVALTVRQRESERALELLLTESTESIEMTGGGRFGALMRSSVETLSRQRPAAADRLLRLGVIQRDEQGRYLVDAGLLARANELLADGARIRVLADVGEAAAVSAEQVSSTLTDIAEASGTGDPSRYIDLATWAFRQSLRAVLSAPRP
jgi:DNA-binding transcriptional MerR regulator